MGPFVLFSRPFQSHKDDDVPGRKGNATSLWPLSALIEELWVDDSGTYFKCRVCVSKSGRNEA